MDDGARRNVKARVSVAMVALSGALLVAGCASYSNFGFPVESGDIGTGQQVFVDFGCHRCHTVAGINLPDIEGAASPRLELGGETSQIKAYSELVTSVINPDHRISDSYRELLPESTRGPLTTQMPMAHIETMTVRQLIDLVAFLDSRYTLIEDYQYDFDDEG